MSNIPPLTPSPNRDKRESGSSKKSKEKTPKDSNVSLLQELRLLREENKANYASLNAKLESQKALIEDLQIKNLELQSKSDENPKFDFRTMSYTKEICLSELNHLNCVSSSSVTNRNTGKSIINHVLNFDLDRENTWFQDSTPDPFADPPDSFGLFKRGCRRPIAARNLTFTAGSAHIEDKTAHSFMTAFPVQCKEPLMQAFFVANPLVASIGATQKKYLSLPESVFAEPQMSLTEVPLFSISDYHSRQSLAVLLAIDQMNEEFRERSKLIMENWDLPKSINLVDGQWVASDISEPSVSTLGESFTKDKMFKEFQSFRARDELTRFGLQTAMDYLKANIVASRHDGRKAVLAHINKEQGSVAYQNLLDSAYNRATLFGPVTDFFRKSITTDRQRGHEQVFLTKYNLSQSSLSSETIPAPAKRSLTPQQSAAVKRQRFQGGLPRNAGRGCGGRNSRRPASRGRGRGRGQGSAQTPKNESRQPLKKKRR